MSDFCTYTVMAVENYRTEQSDEFLRWLADDCHKHICVEWADYEAGEFNLGGFLWHDGINDYIIDAAERYGMSDIPFEIRGVDREEEYYRALTCSFVWQGAANYDDVVVNVVWPKFEV